MRARIDAAVCGSRDAWSGARQSATIGRHSGGSSSASRSGARPSAYACAAAARARGSAPGNGYRPPVSSWCIVTPSAQMSIVGRTGIPRSEMRSLHHSGGRKSDEPTRGA